MKRTEMIKKILDFYESIPEGACDYHKMDMLLSRLERLGMLPPPDGVEAVTSDIVYAYYDERVISDEDGRPIIEKLWEPENEEE